MRNIAIAMLLCHSQVSIQLIAAHTAVSTTAVPTSRFQLALVGGALMPAPPAPPTSRSTALQPTPSLSNRHSFPVSKELAFRICHVKHSTAATRTYPCPRYLINLLQTHIPVHLSQPIHPIHSRRWPPHFHRQRLHSALPIPVYQEIIRRHPCYPLSVLCANHATQASINQVVTISYLLPAPATFAGYLAVPYLAPSRYSTLPPPLHT